MAKNGESSMTESSVAATRPNSQRRPSYAVRAPMSTDGCPARRRCPAAVPKTGWRIRLLMTGFAGYPNGAAIHFAEYLAARGLWIPASAGMTESLSGFCSVSQIGTRSRCPSHKTCRHIPAAFASVGAVRDPPLSFPRTRESTSPGPSPPGVSGFLPPQE